MKKAKYYIFGVIWMHNTNKQNGEKYKTVFVAWQTEINRELQVGAELHDY